MNEIKENAANHKNEAELSDYPVKILKKRAFDSREIVAGDCIGMTEELRAPLFAMARISGLCAHRLEELSSHKRKLIRPAFKNACSLHNYTPLDER